MEKILNYPVPTQLNLLRTTDTIPQLFDFTLFLCYNHPKEITAMKLNPDCIRDILIQLETDLDFPEPVRYHITDDPRILPKYDWYELVYHFKQCSQCGMLEGFQICDSYSSVVINDITYKGHEFLANIRSDKVWKRIMKTALDVGNIALPFIQQIAISYFQKKI